MILLVRARGSQHTFLPGGHLEPGESLNACLARELLEELGLAARVESYLGLIEHSYEAASVTHYELNNVFAVTLPTLVTPLSREAHLSFSWANVHELNEQGLEPRPLRQLLHSPSPGPFWASTLP